MRIPSSIVHLVCGVTIPVSIAFLDDSINTMLPWLITMFFVVFTDLTQTAWEYTYYNNTWHEACLAD